MDDVLRETTHTEIKEILGDKESRNEAPKTQTEKCKKKTDIRLSGLHARIRSETSSKINLSRQIKYEIFDLILEHYKTVRFKEGGGIRYTDVETSTVVTFIEILDVATHLYFDRDAYENRF